MKLINPQFFKTSEKLKPQDVKAMLTASSSEEQRANAAKLLQDASMMGVTVEAALAMYVEGSNGLNGLESTFQALEIPVNYHGNEVAMACFSAATGTFMTNEGLRVLLPALMNNLLRSIERQPSIERVEDLIFGTRLVKGNVLQKEITWDKGEPDSFKTHRIAEGANIPRRTLKASQQAVNFYKTGHAIEMSYEFASSATPDILIPYAARIDFERGQTEHAMAMEVLINGESSDANSINGQVTTVNLDTIDNKAGTALRHRAEGIIQWLINRARAGLAIDTLVVGWDSILDLQLMFPVTNANNTPAAGIGGVLDPANGGTQIASMKVKVVNGVDFNLNIVITSQLGNKQMLGFRKAETVERLIKTNSQIAEQERNIGNQTILYTNTIISGFTLAYGDTRCLLTWT